MGVDEETVLFPILAGVTGYIWDNIGVVPGRNLAVFFSKRMKKGEPLFPSVERRPAHWPFPD